MNMFACLSSPLSGISQVTIASGFACKTDLQTHACKGRVVAAETDILCMISAVLKPPLLI